MPDLLKDQRPQVLLDKLRVVPLREGLALIAVLQREVPYNNVAAEDVVGTLAVLNILTRKACLRACNRGTLLQ